MSHQRDISDEEMADVIFVGYSTVSRVSVHSHGDALRSIVPKARHCVPNACHSLLHKSDGRYAALPSPRQGTGATVLIWADLVV